MVALSFACALALFAAQSSPETPAPQPAPAAPAAKQGDAAPLTIVQQIAALKQEYDAAQQAFSDKYSAAKTDEEKRKIADEDYPDAEKYMARFLALAAHAKGEPAALDCYLWVLQHVQTESTRAPIYATLLADHVASPKLVDAVQVLGRYTTSVAAERFLRGVIEKTPHREVKGFATYALAGVLLSLSDLCERMASPAWTPELQRACERQYGKETVDDVAARDAQEIAKEATDLLEDVAADYKQLKGFQPLGVQAAGDLFELRNLAIGQVAPDIKGFDVDGVPFNLSDYRGKVVVLDFWGFW